MTERDYNVRMAILSSLLDLVDRLKPLVGTPLHTPSSGGTIQEVARELAGCYDAPINLNVKDLVDGILKFNRVECERLCPGGVPPSSFEDKP